ncbi:hypothetical protein [Amycolatopsis sacchari]|nr:hypothetical protein [Amycolatopsis sacchari]
MDAGLREFYDVVGEPGYEIDVNPEFPPDGNWAEPVFTFGPDGRVEPGFAPGTGGVLVLRVTAAEAPAWVGVFPAGDLRGVDGVYAGPAARQMCVLAAGDAYLVQVDAPHAGALVAQVQVQQVAKSLDPALLLLVRDFDIVAIGRSGIAWRSPRLAVDDLRVLAADSRGIHCTGYFLGDRTETVTVDPMTGEVIDGRRLKGTGPGPGPA